jgi:hypothetical protein
MYPTSSRNHPAQQRCINSSGNSKKRAKRSDKFNEKQNK